jgi:hypothetical protein
MRVLTQHLLSYVYSTAQSLQLCCVITTRLLHITSYAGALTALLLVADITTMLLLYYFLNIQVCQSRMKGTR